VAYKYSEACEADMFKGRRHSRLDDCVCAVFLNCVHGLLDCFSGHFMLVGFFSFFR